MGFPSIDRETGKSGYLPMEMFPLEGDPIPQGYTGWLIFMDELNGASKATQMASYKVILDKMVGLQKLHPKAVTVGAGNLETDGAIVERLGTALQSRLIHLQLEIDFRAWLTWATAHAIDYRITSYINFKPDNLFKFDPDHNDKTFACARTWEFASKLLKLWPDEIPPSKLPLLAGTLSEGIAREFMGFCSIFKELPTVQDIILNPEGTRVPEEPSTLYALTGSIANHVKQETVKPLMQFIERLPLEFQVITLQGICDRHRELLTADPVRQWITRNSMDLF